MTNNVISWYAPAGLVRGQITPIMASRSSGKSMVAQQMLLNSLKNQLITTGTSVVTATQSPNMTPISCLILNPV